jgi:hypothetical protein
MIPAGLPVSIRVTLITFNQSNRSYSPTCAPSGMGLTEKRTSIKLGSGAH